MPLRTFFCLCIVVFLAFFFSVPVLVPCCSGSVVPAIVKTTISWYFLLKKTLYRQRQTCESTFSQKMLVLCLSRVSHVFLSVPLLVPCCSGSDVPAIVNLCLWKTTMSWYFLLKKTLYRQRQTCESTFSQKMLVLGLARVSHVFFSVPVLVPCRSVSVVPAIVNLCLWKTTMSWYFLLKKTLHRQRQTCESTFSQKKCSFYVFLVFLVFVFLGTRSRAMLFRFRCSGHR